MIVEAEKVSRHAICKLKSQEAGGVIQSEPQGLRTRDLMV